MADKMVDEIRTMGLNNKIEWYLLNKVLFHGKFEYQDAHLIFLRVLLVGGRDGGILREMSHHSSVEQIDICELDQMLIDVYKQFFYEIAVGYVGPQVKVYINDGTYYAIILDAFESMGATAIELANKEFLESMACALRLGGVMSAPADSFWLDNFTLEDTIAECRQIFKGSVRYTWCSIPSYSIYDEKNEFSTVYSISGTIGFVLCYSDRPAMDFEKSVNPLDTKNNRVAKGPFKFYDSQIHAAALCLPSFAKKVGSARF
ncbi:hypothetical protein ACJRO7_013551 [Eucalyptus globulus]|uniref:PABS domain-containing protein n=1 Tax=Eucalyptus globulus TaxID=34317 RepID=A0ABD3L389_EUCGL